MRVPEHPSHHQTPLYKGDSEDYVRDEGKLGPELLLACFFHRSQTLGAGFLVPDADVVAAAVQAETANFASVGRRHIGNDTPDHDVLNGLAVRTAHGGNLLAEEAAALVDLSLIATGFTTIFQFPGHWREA